MRVTPTFSSALIITISTALLGVSAITGHPTAVAWSGALLLGLAVARVQSRANLVRARAAGFEMLWNDVERNAHCQRLDELRISAALRNRSENELVITQIMALAPPELSIRIDATSGILPPHSTLVVTLNICPLRVGLHGVQGLTVMVRDAGAAFEAQLTFANPILVEALPQISSARRALSRGGLGRHRAAATRTRPLSGDSVELRELREYQRSDPLRKIAWKASAKRSILLVRDDEKEQHRLVYFVLDASVELWAGLAGQSALDLQIDAIATAMVHSLQRGDRVGLVVVASRVLASIPPACGKAHERKLISALVHATATRDHDRSSIDEQDVAAVILEHLRPIDPTSARRLKPHDIDGVCRLAQRYVNRAPLTRPPEPKALAVRERILRNYLAAFGLPSPPRTTPERDRTDRELVSSLSNLLPQRPDRISIYSPYPSAQLLEGLRGIFRQIRKARIELDWAPTDVMSGRAHPAGTVGQIVELSAQWHNEILRNKGALALRRLGIRTIVTTKNRTLAPPVNE